MIQVIVIFKINVPVLILYVISNTFPFSSSFINIMSSKFAIHLVPPPLWGRYLKITAAGGASERGEISDGGKMRAWFEDYSRSAKYVCGISVWK